MEINTFERIYGKNELYVFERIAASENVSGSFISTSFIEESDVVTAIYRYDGYMKISECRFGQEIQLLNLIGRVIRLSLKVSECFISIDRIGLSIDTVFYSPEREDVKLAFMVSRKRQFRSELISFAKELKEHFNLEEHTYLDALISYISDKENSVDEILDQIESLKSKARR